MRLHRFYVNRNVTQPLGEEIVVDDVSTIKQWYRVFRYKQDDHVILFDGHNVDYEYSIVSITPTEATLGFVSKLELPPLRKQVTLYLSIIKKDNFELVVQKCTELGVTTIVPIISERSEKKNLSLERLRTIAIEASEQSGRATIPTISDIKTLENAFSTRNELDAHYICDMGGVLLSDILSRDISMKTSISLWVGPEGGWGPLDKEIFASKTTTTISTGSNVLRAETAAIIISSFFLLL